MNQSKIAVRYAKAFFQVAQEKGKQDKLRADVDLLFEMCMQEDFNLLLNSPVIKTSRKKEIFSKILSDKVDSLTVGFVNMITDNKREAHIPAICRNFIDQYRELKGIKAAKVTTAVALDDILADKIKSTISELFKTEVELSTEENSDLIGGFVLRVGDKQIDASVASKLRQIEREFLKTTL